MQLSKTIKCLISGLLAFMLVISLLGGAAPVMASQSSEKTLTSMTLSHSVVGIIDEDNKSVLFEFPSDHPIDMAMPIKFSHTGVSATVSGIELTSPTHLMTHHIRNSSIVIKAEDGTTSSYSIIITQLPSDGSPQITGIVVDPNPVWRRSNLYC